MTLKQNKKIWGAVVIACAGGVAVAYMLALFVLLFLQEHAIIPQLGIRFWAACGNVFDGMCWVAGFAGVLAVIISAGYLFAGRVRLAVASFALSIGAGIITVAVVMSAFFPFFPVALVIDSARSSLCGQ